MTNNSAKNNRTKTAPFTPQREALAVAVGKQIEKEIRPQTEAFTMDGCNAVRKQMLMKQNAEQYYV